MTGNNFSNSSYVRARRTDEKSFTTVKCGGAVIGGGTFTVIAGPCSVESGSILSQAANAVSDGGAHMLRGGSYKPRSSPYSFQGLELDGLKLLHETGRKAGLPVVSEITDAAFLAYFEQYTDLIQVGARNMQNFSLLRALGKSKKPVLLKRGFGNTAEELLLSAEYILDGGNENVILCERGIRTFESCTRYTLDISAVCHLKINTHLPVIVDPSHACGRADMVIPLSLAAAAAGADGIITEIHPEPENALSDGGQSLTPEQFFDMMEKLRPVVSAIGKKL